MKLLRIAAAMLALSASHAFAQGACIPSGETDIHTYFVAVDATDRVSFETALSSFTVYRTRNGAAEVAYTTPTITEIDATNTPGLYELLVDEDTTIGSGNDYEPYALRITHASMVPVTKEICIARAKITLGETVTAASGNANSDPQAGTIVAADIGADAITNAKVSSDLLPNAAPDAAGGLPISDAGGLDLDAILADTADMQPKLGTFPDLGSGATLGGNLEDMRDDGTAAFSRTTDSQQAIRDRGDTAWITATGFSTHSAADVWTSGTRLLTAGTNIVLAKGTGITGFNDLSAAQVNAEADTALTDYDPPTRTELTADKAEIMSMLGQRESITVTDQDTFTLTNGPDRNDAFNPWAVMLLDTSNAGETDLVRVLDYVGSSKTVELARAAAFTIATGDIAVFLPAFLDDPVETAFVNCEVNTANFAGSTMTVACILTDREGAAVTAATGDLTGLELRVTSGAQIYEGRFINSTTWDAANSELQLTLSRALPGTLADAVTAIIR